MGGLALAMRAVTIMEGAGGSIASLLLVLLVGCSWTQITWPEPKLDGGGIASMKHLVSPTCLSSPPNEKNQRIFLPGGSGATRRKMSGVDHNRSELVSRLAAGSPIFM